MISLRALGKAEMVTEAGHLTPSQEMLFATALYLLIERPKRISRATLAELLWAEAPDRVRHHRLRQTLLQLKHAGVPFTANRETVGVALEAACSDLDVLLIHGAGDLSLLQNFQFLPGYAPQFSRPYSDWLDSKRSEVTAAATRILLGEIQRARARGDWGKVERVAMQCMEVDPFNEEAVLARAEGSAMRGAKREAVSILDRYVAELGPGTADIRLPATLMRKRIAERLPHAEAFGRAERIFVGREADMEVLTTVLGAARNGHGRCCLVWGDPGIGKSRLSCERARFAELQGVQARRVACRRGDLHRPLSAFVELVPQLLQMRGALGCSPEAISDLARLTQFEIKVGHKRELDADPQSVYESIRAAIFDLVDALAEEQSLLIIVEDVHWLDPASARIFGQLADWSVSKRLLLLFTSRVAETHVADACTQAGLLKHQVRELSSKATTALIEEMFKSANETLDDDFVAWCIEMGDGNPFFVHELVKQWFETKRRHVIPPSITTVVQERVSRLSSPALQVLQACAVLGDNATLSRVEWMLDLRPHEFLGALQELFSGAMLTRERPGVTQGTGKIAARHEFVADGALVVLGDHARTYLHRRAGQVLEKDFDDGPQNASLVWACAAHWKNAGDRDRAFLLAKRCADHLLGVGLPGDAADALEKVRPFCRSKAEDVSILDMKISALRLAGRWLDVKASILEIRKAQGIAEQHDDYELANIDAMWKSSLDFWEPVAAAKLCADCHEAPTEHRVRAACLALKMASDQGRLELMDEIYAIVAPLLDSSAADVLSRLELQLVYQCDRGDVEEASSIALQLAAAARETGDIIAITRAAHNASTVLRLTGQFDEARTLLLETIKTAVSRRRDPPARELIWELVKIYLAEGNIAAAREEMNRFAGLKFPSDDSLSGVDFVYLNTRLCLEEGKLREAEACCAELLTKTDTLATHRRATILAVGVQVFTALNEQKPKLLQMLSELEHLHLQYRHQACQDYEAYSLYLGLCGIGEQKRAVELFRDYVTVHRRDHSPLPEAMVAIAL